MLAAIVINMAGGWVRYFADDSFGIALFGQYLAALAQNVVLFVPVCNIFNEENSFINGN